MTLSTARWESWAFAVGLALLYTSAFYLPAVGTPQSYWIPHVTREILYPAVIGTAILVPATRMLLLRYLQTRNWIFIEQVPVAALALIAFTGGFAAVGYSATDLIVSLVGRDATLEVTRWSRVSVFAAMFLIVGIGMAALKTRRETVIRLLSTFGYTYALLAILRAEPLTVDPKLKAGTSPTSAGATSYRKESLTRPREVIWIIFDEMDYNQTLGSPSVQRAMSMPNLYALSKLGVSAAQAYSPARDTEVSIPSLLLGLPPIGDRINANGLFVHAYDGSFQHFDEAHSVFSRLPGGPGTGAILGYYHPYCNVFPSTAPCVALPEANVGRWFDALVPFSQPGIAAARWLPGSGMILPGALFRTFEPMYYISEETTRQFSRFLTLNDRSLVFIHVNLPHPPGDYSQRALHFKNAADDRESYRRNLRLVDDMIGVAVATLRTQVQKHDILLIVSSDHWHRIDSPHVAQPIPWIAWHVAESVGATLDWPINTVHTADLSLDFLRGNIFGQDDIVKWWHGRTFYSPLMPEHYSD
jgi:hypothetical protein